MRKIYDGLGNALSVPQKNDKYLRVPWKSSFHTGYSSATVPHNTLQAFHRAWLAGAECVEIDIQLTSDGVHVCSHDETITDPATETTYTISETPWNTIKNIVLAHDDYYGDIKPSKIEDILRFCACSGMMANLDCKTIDENEIATMVVRCNMSGKTIYAATGIPAFLRILQIDPLAGALILYQQGSSTDTWLDAWNNALDEETIKRSYVTNVFGVFTQEILMDALSKGYKYEFISQTSLIRDFETEMIAIPDIYQFAENADIASMNAVYLARFTSMPISN